MKKNYILLIIALAAACLIYFYSKKARAQKIYSHDEACKIIEDVYADVSGFSIDMHERQFIEDNGGNPTYGEITPEAVSRLLEDLKLTDQDVFFDLGCGVGKGCVQVALCTPAQAIGIELSPSRAKAAQAIKEKLMNEHVLSNEQKLQMIEQNIIDTDLSNATVIFLCSTCFSDALMQTLTNKMAQESRNGLRVITLKDLAPHKQFTLIKQYELPMSWSQSSAVSLYELEKN